MASELVDVDADLIHQTDGAFKLRTDDGKIVWVPKACCEHNGGTSFTMERRTAEEKGLV